MTFWARPGSALTKRCDRLVDHALGMAAHRGNAVGEVFQLLVIGAADVLRTASDLRCSLPNLG